jgi:hypothetical protein
LGKLIDELEKLDEKEFLRRREEMLAKASKWDEDKHGQYEQSLEAIEFVQAERGYKPLEFDEHYRESSDKSTARRRSVRLLIEDGIRKTGSLEDSIKGLTNAPKDWEMDFDFFRKEANTFGQEFTRQARELGIKLLEESEREIYRVVESYGLRHLTAGYAAKELIGDSDKLDAVVERILNSPDVWYQEKEVQTKSGTKYDPWVTHRRDLADAAAALRAQQKVVGQRWDELMQTPSPETLEDAYDHPEKARQHDLAYQRWNDEVEQLQRMWARAEREHPALAAFRGGKQYLADVNLGALDAPSAAPQMAAMLKAVLPKLAAILDIKGRLAGGHLDPLSLPPVVALTKATMFVPEGSIRAGKVNDLVEKAQDRGVLKYIGLGLLALIAIAAAIPTAGESLGVGIGMIGAALSASSAIEDWQDYKLKRTLTNTALDRAKALSIEDPSLLPFALDLVFLGLDGAPLVKVFGKGIQLRHLVHAGAEEKAVKKVVDEINDLTKTKGVGEKALDEVKAAEREEQAAGKAAGEGEPTTKKPAATEAKPVAKPAIKKPPGQRYSTVDELRDAIYGKNGSLRKLSNGSTNMNQEWMKVLDIDRSKLAPATRKLFDKVDKVYDFIRDLDGTERDMERLWELAGREGKSPQRALVHYFGGESGMPRVMSTDAEEFHKALLADKPFIDRTLEKDYHGAFTHMFQEYRVAEKFGKDWAKQFRHDIAKLAEEDVVLVDGTVLPGKLYTYVWDGLFDALDNTQINSPEGLGRILMDHLGFTRRLP